MYGLLIALDVAMFMNVLNMLGADIKDESLKSPLKFYNVRYILRFRIDYFRAAFTGA